MKKTQIIIVISALILTMLVFAGMIITDWTAINDTGNTVFAKPMQGGEVIDYIGLGYSIEIFFPLTTPEEAALYDTGPFLRISPFIFIDIIIVSSIIAVLSILIPFLIKKLIKNQENL